MRYFMIACLIGVAAGLLIADDVDDKPRLKRGLVAHYYKDHENWKGNWPDSVSVPDVDAEDWTFTEYRYSRVEPLVNHLFVKKGWFTVRWVGYLDTNPRKDDDDDDDDDDDGVVSASEEKEYKFEIVADDGCRLFIDGNKIIDDWKPCWEKSEEARRMAEPIKLTRGKHRIVVEYFQGQSLKGDDQDPMKLYWSCRDRKIRRQIIPGSHFCHTKKDETNVSR
jgi:hypothetical protein